MVLWTGCLGASEWEESVLGTGEWSSFVFGSSWWWLLIVERSMVSVEEYLTMRLVESGVSSYELTSWQALCLLSLHCSPVAWETCKNGKRNVAAISWAGIERVVQNVGIWVKLECCTSIGLIIWERLVRVELVLLRRFSLLTLYFESFKHIWECTGRQNFLPLITCYQPRITE